MNVCKFRIMFHLIRIAWHVAGGKKIKINSSPRGQIEIGQNILIIRGSKDGLIGWWQPCFFFFCFFLSNQIIIRQINDEVDHALVNEKKSAV